MGFLDGLEASVEKIKKKNRAKEEYKKIKGKTKEKDPCEHCNGASAEINIGDTICVEKTNPKKICTDKWHETVGLVEKFDDRRMTFLGYDESTKGFIIKKICPVCYRIIFSKTF